jgi:site-specific recombinase XerD
MRSAVEEQICAKARTISGPLGKYVRQFQSFQEREHYSRERINHYALCIEVLDRLMGESRVDVKNLDENAAINLVSKSDKSSSWKKRAEFPVRNFVKFLAELGATKVVLTPVLVETPRMHLRKDYEEYLRRQRGLTEKTIRHSWYAIDRFLRFCFHGQEDNLSLIIPLKIIEFIQLQVSRRKYFYDKTQSTHLRNFLLFLFKSGKTATNLAGSIPRIAQPHRATLPRHLSPEQVETLIAAVRTNTPAGRRNYAMVLLQARLGLRATEVIAIQTEDINWRTGEILIRGKGQRHDRMPLPQDVGEVLANYIQQDRRTTSKTLFVAEHAPRKPLRDAQVLNEILKEAFIKTGLKPPTRSVGSHILRHSLAMKLMNRGASLPEVGDVLRHRSRPTTMIYAKVDIEGLRSIAQSWPVEGGVK